MPDNVPVSGEMVKRGLSIALAAALGAGITWFLHSVLAEAQQPRPAVFQIVSSTSGQAWRLNTVTVKPISAFRDRRALLARKRVDDERDLLKAN